MKKFNLLFIAFVLAGTGWSQADCNDNTACNFDASAAGETECEYAITWYVDIDGDGKGVSTDADVIACEAPNALYVNEAGDACPSDPNKTLAGTCGCGVPETDTDSDNTPNCSDECPYDFNKTLRGQCGCGVAETDTDSDGTPDCIDLCPSDPLKTNPGTCGCGVVDSGDSDSDGYLDCIDVCPGSSSQVDTDGDGVGDECEVLGCTFVKACNYNILATEEDGTCEFADASKCQICSGSSTDGTGVVDPDGPCDCTGTDTLYVDALGVCGGPCGADSDDDGICDLDTDGDGEPEDPCIGQDIDDCGVCGGSDFFLNASGIPCDPSNGDSDCLNSNNECNCAGDTLNSCLECGAPEPLDGFDCNGDCLDANNNDICDFDEVSGCMDETNCNYNELANVSDASQCLATDSCGVCGGNGIPLGACDCEGNLPAEYYDCDGNCLNDADGDGLCDEYENLGCLDSLACNYNPNASTLDATICVYKDEIDVCGGSCTADVDNDNICDVDDPCVGVYDECGVCNGLGIPAGQCDCFGNVLDSLNVCGGSCLLDADGDGICDLDSEGQEADLNDCSGTLDAVGVCNGTCNTDADGDGLCDHDTTGDLIPEDPCLGSADNFVDECGECGGSGIEAGKCDCDGNTVDELGICGGGCTADTDSDGVCDDVDPCVGIYDECGVCNGAGIAEGACDCDGNTADFFGNCGGGCVADDDNDGVCDYDSDGNQIDPCVGVLDSCGVCNGSGPLPDCGCEPAIAGYCDCNENVIDDCGVCGGPGPEFGKDCDGNCLSDANANGICDALEDVEIIRGLQLDQSNSDELRMNLEPFSVEDAMQEMIDLHRKMATNLDDGALRGSSQNLEVQKTIVDHGSLVVDEQATFAHNVEVQGSVHVVGDIEIDGDITIEGVTFANGGLSTTTIDMSGDLVVDENLNATGQLDVQSEARLFGRTAVSGDLNIFDGHDGGSLSSENVFSVHSKSGSVDTEGSLDADADVIVDGFTQLDGLNVEGQSTMHHATVDGSLDLNSSADVDGVLRINSNKFIVDGETGNASTQGAFVTGGNTHVLNHLLVQGTATIEGTTFANGGVETSTIEMEGDLTVGGNAVVKMTMNVGEDVTNLGSIGVGGDFAVHNGSASDTTLNPQQNFRITGVSGDVHSSGFFKGQNFTVAQTMVSNGKTKVNGSMSVDGTTTLHGTSTVTGGSTLDETTVLGAVNALSNVTSSKGLALTGEAKLDQLNVEGTTSLKETKFSGTPSGSGALLKVSSSSEYVATFENTGTVQDQNGIQVKMGKPAPGHSNDYITFRNSNGIMMGRIEGELSTELGSNDNYVADKLDIDAMVRNAEVSKDVAVANHVMAGISMTLALADVVASAVSVTGCAGFGFCVTGPIWSYIAAAAANVVSAAVLTNDAINTRNEAESLYTEAVATRTAFNKAVLGDMETVGSSLVGVTFQSGSADYAEWIPKANKEDQFLPGQIIGVKQGAASLNTTQADQLFVVSTDPIVLGNTPPKDEDSYVQAAFLGQVPVRVRGEVRSGDYILTSGLNDGFGVAISPDKLTGLHIRNVVGVAWNQGQKEGVNVVNVAVGFQDGLIEFTSRMESRIRKLESETTALENMVYSWARGEKPNRLQAQKAGLIPPLIVNEPERDVDWTQQEAWLTPGVDEVEVFDIPDEALVEGIDRAVAMAREDGIDVDNHPIWSLLEKDEAFRNEFKMRIGKQIREHNESVVAQLLEYQAVEITSPRPYSEFLSEPIIEKPMPTVSPARPKDANSNHKRQ